MIIKLLEVQLKASNATIDQLNLTIDNMSASMNAMAVTISEADREKCGDPRC